MSGEAKPADLLAFSTNSREDEPAVAALKVEAVCREAGAAQVPLVFKKVDSVLRGNVGVEVAAMLRATGRPGAVLCTAFPEQGRVVRGGKVVTGAATIPVPVIPGVGNEDAETRADLDRIAAGALAREPWPLLVGSSGLAGSVAGLLRMGDGPQELASDGEPALCIGSLHPVTLGQLDHLQGTGRTDYRLIRIETECPDFDVTGGLFLCGGDTALMACERLGVESIELYGELMPGIPVGRIAGGKADGRMVITKSGGFGAVDVLDRVLNVLSGGGWRASQ